MFDIIISRCVRLCLWERSREGYAILTCDEGELSRHRIRAYAHTSTYSPLQTLPPSCPPMSSSTEPHSCDTLPPARPLLPSPPSLPPQSSPRKLCVRHQRIADEGTNLKLQQVRVVLTPDLITSRYPSLDSHCPRLSTTSPSRKGNPSMPSGLAFPHRSIPAASSSFAAS